MNRSLCLIGVICIFASSWLNAQEQQVSNDRMTLELRKRALVLEIGARVLENEQNVIWSESHQKITVSGTPVGIQLVGSNVAVAVQFTPYLRRHGSVLVSQVQIWYNDPEKGVSYHTSIQTIPIEFDEPIYFFPLGQAEGASTIEIVLEVKRYREAEFKPADKTENDE